ncbi:MAG: hypothetical protein EG828_03805 [Deltaproteobacteria bacterium]|nr:hypothetical protein [Deltaproteobacteria bacterium]
MHKSKKQEKHFSSRNPQIIKIIHEAACKQFKKTGSIAKSDRGLYSFSISLQPGEISLAKMFQDSTQTFVTDV